MHIDLSKYRGLSIRSFDMVELTGKDSIAAAARAVPTSGSTSMFIANLQHRDQMIADAITHVNGEQVVRPFVEWQNWNLRTQEFVTEVFEYLNTVPRGELQDFRTTVLGIPTPAPVAST